MEKKFNKLSEAINSMPVDFVSKFNSVYGVEFVVEDGKITGCYTTNGGKE